MTDRLDTKSIADYLGVTRAHVTDVLVKRPDFPVPVINRSARLRRWSRQEVEEWAARRPDPKGEAA